MLLTLLLCSIWAATICVSALCRAAKWGDRLGDNFPVLGAEALTDANKGHVFIIARTGSANLPTGAKFKASRPHPSPADLCIKPRTLGRLLVLNPRMMI